MSSPFDIAVLIGRFQPFHNAHFALLRQALALAPEVVVVLGSAHQARSPKNPLSWRERAQMIQLAAGADAMRLRLVPVRDYYDHARWVQAVVDGVASIAPRARNTVLVGHRKDATSYYLEHFPGWQLQCTDRIGDVDATHLRRALLGADNAAAALALLRNHMPDACVDYLQAWTQMPQFARVRDEWRHVRAYREQFAGAPYEPVFVTADALVTCSDHVLLVRRGGALGHGLWALPGGFVEPNERLLQAALRELQEEAGLALLPELAQVAARDVRVFDHPQRSSRGRTITHVHRFDLGDSRLPQLRAGDDAAEARWIPLSALPDMEELFFEDHAHILDAFLGVPWRSEETRPAAASHTLSSEPDGVAVAG